MQRPLLGSREKLREGLDTGQVEAGIASQSQRVIEHGYPMDILHFEVHITLPQLGDRGYPLHTNVLFMRP